MTETRDVPSEPSTLHGVVYYPRLGSEELDCFRDRYDPFAGLISEHLTPVFPVPVRHIGIGFFGAGEYDPLDPEPVDLDAETYDAARREAAELGIRASRRLESVTVVRLERGHRVLTEVDEIPLGGVDGGEG